MKKLLIVLLLQCAPLIAIGGEIILDEETARSVMAELSEASRNFDVDVMRKYVDSESRFIWKTTIEGGKDGREATGDEWLKLMEFFSGMTPVSDENFRAEIRSVQIDEELNQATIIEDITSVSQSLLGTYEELAVETNILGVRNGSIKVIYSEKVTTKVTQVE